MYIWVSECTVNATFKWIFEIGSTTLTGYKHLESKLELQLLPTYMIDRPAEILSTFERQVILLPLPPRQTTVWLLTLEFTLGIVCLLTRRLPVKSPTTWTSYWKKLTSLRYDEHTFYTHIQLYIYMHSWWNKGSGIFSTKLTYTYGMPKPISSL